MTNGDVTTESKRGQWVNSVEGDNALSTSYSSKDEAIEEGRQLAERLGGEQRVIEAESTGVITDPGQD